MIDWLILLGSFFRSNKFYFPILFWLIWNKNHPSEISALWSLDILFVLLLSEKRCRYGTSTSADCSGLLQIHTTVLDAFYSSSSNYPNNTLSSISSHFSIIASHPIHRSNFHPILTFNEYIYIYVYIYSSSYLFIYLSILSFRQRFWVPHICRRNDGVRNTKSHKRHRVCLWFGPCTPRNSPRVWDMSGRNFCGFPSFYRPVHRLRRTI